MITKGANGVNLADMFAASHVSDLPKSTRQGRQAEPIDDKVLANIRAILSKEDAAVVGNALFGCTQKELADYNTTGLKSAAVDGKAFNPVADVVALAKRFATNGAGPIRRYVAIVAAEQSKAVGIRVVNEGTDATPKVRWYLLLVNPRPRAENVHGA